MEFQIWWIWMAIAALFIIGEIFTQGFFLLWFGIGAAVAGVLAILGLGVGWQLGAFVAWVTQSPLAKAQLPSSCSRPLPQMRLGSLCPPIVLRTAGTNCVSSGPIPPWQTMPATPGRVRVPKRCSFGLVCGKDGSLAALRAATSRVARSHSACT